MPHGPQIPPTYELRNSRAWYGHSMDFNDTGDMMVVGVGWMGYANEGAYLYRYNSSTSSWDKDTNFAPSDTRTNVRITGDGNRILTANPGRFKYLTITVKQRHGQVYSITYIRIECRERLDANNGADMSSDGTTIVFNERDYSANPGDKSTIRRVNSNGSWNVIGTIDITSTGGDLGPPALSSDGNRLALGIYRLGQVRVYDYAGGTTWNQVGSTIYTPDGGTWFGSFVDMTPDGTTIAVCHAR